MDSMAANASLDPTPHLMHHHGLPILQTHLAPSERAWWTAYAASNNYFTISSNHTACLYTHIALGLLAAYLVYPIVLVLSNTRRRTAYTVGIAIHSTLVFISLFSYVSFIKSTPDLYPHAAYPKMLWILAVSTILHGIVVAALWYFEPTASLQHESESVFSVDSNHEELTASSLDLERDFLGNKESDSRFEHTKLAKALARTAQIMNWAQLAYFLILIPTGVLMFLVIGQGTKVFGLLAHFIKGGVFFVYGMLSLFRYCGAYKQKGWAWNRVVTHSALKYTCGLLTMEMVESALILFYGCTNIFLERLASTGGAWNAKDLQHALIAFIYIGCGLCGVITELQLGTWRRSKAIEGYASAQDGTPGYLPNPFPALTIFCTGIIMSKHIQLSELSTNIHVLWGNFLVAACVFRVVTYLVIPTLDSSSPLGVPRRPLLELIVSFCLLSGGLIFMESTETVVWIYEYHGWTSMFILNVLAGVVALVMAWIMLLSALKEWLC